MDVNELIQLNSDKVRRNSSLMRFYIECFSKTFGYIPDCAGCNFNSDFNKLKVALSNDKKIVNLTNKTKKMENTFKLKRIEGNILAYRKDKKTFRLYDNSLNEEFVISFLTNGTAEEIEQRKKLFSKLPKLEEKQVSKPKKTKK